MLSSSKAEEQTIMDFEFPLPLDRQLGFALYGAFIAVGRTYRLWLDQIGLTYPQYLVLSVLWEGDDQTISAIASRLDLEPSTITPLVKRLEQAGFVVRQRNPQDERQVKVTLTEQGRAIRARTKALAEALYRKAGNAGMTVADLADLNTRVKALRDAFGPLGSQG
jgi:MarR family transcriptional regulator, organic hydroperoxide resistance regulator